VDVEATPLDADRAPPAGAMRHQMTSGPCVEPGLQLDVTGPGASSWPRPVPAVVTTGDRRPRMRAVAEVCGRPVVRLELGPPGGDPVASSRGTAGEAVDVELGATYRATVRDRTTFELLERQLRRTGAMRVSLGPARCTHELAPAALGWVEVGQASSR
jgi:hypothetical protein